MSDARYNLTDVLDRSFQAHISEVHTAIPGRIETYNAAKKKVSVKPLIKVKFANEETATSVPIINNVPVIFPSTNNSIISFPLIKGDGCLIIFSERSMEKYLSTAITLESEPIDKRKFSLSDAICIPGLFSFTTPGKVPVDTTALEILHDAGYVNIQGNTNFAVLYNELKAKMDALQAQLRAHVHPDPQGGSTGASATLFDCDISGAKSTKVKLGG